MKKVHICFVFILVLFSCKKDKVPQIDPNACKDEMFINKNLRFSGTWELQSNSNTNDPAKIEFINDSMLRLTNNNEWFTVKYKIICNEFMFDMYWISDPGPFQNWYQYSSSYNPVTKVWLIRQNDFFMQEIDSCFYVKK